MALNSKIKPVELTGEKVVLIDQTILPYEYKKIEITNYKDMAKAIKDMIVRGAPAIGISGAHGVALAALEFKNLNKEAARIIRKVLTSATANAENNLGLDKNNLYVKEAYVNEGQTMKRARMGSRGHVDPIKKRTSHITVVVSEKN